MPIYKEYKKYFVKICINGKQILKESIQVVQLIILM